MMEVEYDNNNNDNIDHPQQVLEQEQQRRQAADADTAANDDDSTEKDDVDADGADVDAVLLQLLSIVQHQQEFPFRTRNKIVALAEEYIEHLKDDIHDMLCDQNPDAEHYQGLDINRDTVAEVETAVQFFPELLSRRDVHDDDYPIQCLPYTFDSNRHFVCNWRAIPFIALLARLAIKFNQFEVEERGGLLIEDEQGYNTLKCLTKCSHSSYDDNHQQLVDNVCLTQMIQLKRIDLFKKEDIPQHQLFIDVCSNCNFSGRRRIQFLVEWDPTVLLQPDDDEDGWLPLHWAARKCFQRFQDVFEYGIIYYPNKKGINLLFTKDEDTDAGDTPFDFACQKHGRDNAMKAIEEILIRHNSVETPLLNIVDALLTAAIDINVHIDGVYFLLRRQPDVLFQLLHDVRDGNNVPVDSSISGDGGGGGGGGGHNYDDDDANDDEMNGKHQDNNDDDDNDSNNDGDGDGDGDGKDENDENDEGNHEEDTTRNNRNKRKRAR